MKEKRRKIRPNPPRWSFLTHNGLGEDCYKCRNTNNCNRCKRAKEQVFEQKNKKRKITEKMI